MKKSPPFSITPAILSASMQITRMLGELDGFSIDKPKVVLRRSNKIKTIQASLAIEGNTLSFDQVSDILDGVSILGPENDITEVKNAIAAYDMISTLSYSSQPDFLKVHKIMLQSLIKDAGKLRTGNVGVFSGPQVTHVAPQHKMVPNLVSDLFSFLTQKDEISLLIKSCIFHYELEFIHPFSDGNGRMGRFWQHLMLGEFHEVFQFVSIESLIKDKQNEYYAVLAQCDSEGESTFFIEFSLSLIVQSLQAYCNGIQYQPTTALDRLRLAHNKLEGKFSRKEYANILKNISTATASRDLKLGIEEGLLKKTGDKRMATYEFIQKKQR